MRRELGQRLRMRHTPELEFHYDKGLDATDRVAQLLAENRAPSRSRHRTARTTRTRRREAQVHGVLVVDKPAGPTSHDIVDRVRRALGDAPRRATRARSTPSPPACCRVCVGKATRLARFLTEGEKAYAATRAARLRDHHRRPDGRAARRPRTRSPSTEPRSRLRCVA